LTVETRFSRARRLAPTGTRTARSAITCACSTTVLGWVEVLVDERDVVRRDADRVPAALRRAVVRVLRAALSDLRAVVLAVVLAASAVLAAVVPPELLVSAM
jgi:hypothetical protein